MVSGCDTDERGMSEGVGLNNDYGEAGGRLGTAGFCCVLKKLGDWVKILLNFLRKIRKIFSRDMGYGNQKRYLFLSNSSSLIEYNVLQESL